MRIKSLDHLVLTVTDIEATCRFYSALGMEIEIFHPADGSTRTALSFGNQKINLHLAGAEFEPKSEHPTPGSADLCFLVDGTLDGWADHLSQSDILIESGPVPRTGATGPITSIYMRDPDANLIELSVQV